MKVVRYFVLQHWARAQFSTRRSLPVFLLKIRWKLWPVMFGACCYPLPNLKGKSKAKFIDPRIYTRGMLRENETFEWKYRSQLRSQSVSSSTKFLLSSELKSLEFSPSNQPKCSTQNWEGAAPPRENCLLLGNLECYPFTWKKLAFLGNHWGVNGV